jgi:hypothetical protein
MEWNEKKQVTVPHSKKLFHSAEVLMPGLLGTESMNNVAYQW